MKRALRAGLTYFAMVFGAGFLLGMVRVPLLVPRLGERMAELLEMPVMFVVILLAARFLVRRFSLAPALSGSGAAGVIGLALLLGAELTLALLLQDQSLASYLASRDPISGSVYLVMLVVYAAMPTLVAYHRRVPRAPNSTQNRNR